MTLTAVAVAGAVLGLSQASVLSHPALAAWAPHAYLVLSLFLVSSAGVGRAAVAAFAGGVTLDIVAPRVVPGTGALVAVLAVGLFALLTARAAQRRRTTLVIAALVTSVSFQLGVAVVSSPLPESVLGLAPGWLLVRSAADALLVAAAVMVARSLTTSRPLAAAGN